MNANDLRSHIVRARAAADVRAPETEALVVLADLVEGLLTLTAHERVVAAMRGSEDGREKPSPLETLLRAAVAPSPTDGPPWPHAEPSVVAKLETLAAYRAQYKPTDIGAIVREVARHPTHDTAERALLVLASIARGYLTEKTPDTVTDLAAASVLVLT